MRYEPTGYVIEYEIGALAIFLVILLRYFSARRFPSQKNLLYALILRLTVANVVLDVVSSLIIDNVFRVPLWLVYTANTLFYAVSVLMLLLMMLFTLALTTHIDRRTLRRYFPLCLPAIFVFLLLLSNPLTRWFFYVDPVEGYIHSTLFGSIYIACFVYLVFTLAIVLRNRHALRHEEYSTILLFLVVVLLSALIQYLAPAVLATSVAIMLSVVLMYFTIQNPEAMMDATTGAFTSEAMLTFLHDRCLAREHVQLIGIKIQNMSRVNELLGVESGSVLLRQICDFLGKSADGAWVFRMRGSGFVAITQAPSGFAALCRRLDARIGSPWIVNNTEVLLQAVVCRVTTEQLMPASVTPEDLVSYLETAFLQGEKSAGRIVRIEEGKALLDRVQRNGMLEAALRNALSDGEGLELYYQPLWSVKQARFVSAEVLLRFRHPTLGVIPPDEFVSIAENCGLIKTMDEFVVRKACAFLQKRAQFQALGLTTLEINLSALEFMQRSLPEVLGDIMEQYHIDPSLLCFEVTETAATESFDLLQECMREIRRYGCRFALDDFGTGFANISQVIRLPFSVVKLDKTLLNGPAAVLEDLVGMFARIDMDTVIEGVETVEQAERVKSYGVDVIQGFYYARPMCEADLIRFLLTSQERTAL